eukprot:gene19172-4264_t
MSRPQSQDVIAAVFTNYVELEGDGRGGLAMLGQRRCVEMGQSEAIATNLVEMALLRVPIATII